MLIECSAFQGTDNRLAGVFFNWPVILFYSTAAEEIITSALKKQRPGNCTLFVQKWNSQLKFEAILNPDSGMDLETLRFLSCMP